MTSSPDLFADTKRETGPIPVVRLVAKIDRRPELRERIREEYVRRPGHSMTLDQTRQRFNLERSTCTELLESLLAEGFLSIDAYGRYHSVAG